MNRFFLCAAVLLFLAPDLAHADDSSTQASTPLRKGDAILVRIEGLGGGLPEYREVIDSDGQIEVPFLGFLAADGKLATTVEADMADTYAKAHLATNAIVRITFVTHFDPAPARASLIRSRDPRRPVPAPGMPAPPAPNP